MPIGLPEFVDNPENRCPVILLLDTSASMSGIPIQELNRRIAVFKEDVLRDEQASLSVEVAIIKFGGSVNLLQDFVTIDNFKTPVMEANGDTPMGQAIEYALDLLETRKATYKENHIQYYRPWVFLITDGAPTDNWQLAAQKLREAEESRRLLFFAVGVEGADFNTLKQIAPPNRPPVQLNGLDFRSLFVWLSSSMKRISCGSEYQLLFKPDKGEYINETTFITSSDALKEMQVSVLQGQQEFICAATDGLERVAIRLRDWTPHSPFFYPFKEYMKETDNPSENHEYLTSFLDSEQLNARTHDDKTMLLCLYEEVKPIIPELASN